MIAMGHDHAPNKPNKIIYRHLFNHFHQLSNISMIYTHFGWWWFAKPSILQVKQTSHEVEGWKITKIDYQNPLDHGPMIIPY